jgi:23S rRNA (cytidine1920-2'-O)/16S rRNA (cytidine1409-2'-O)-methyltransferase
MIPDERPIPWSYMRADLFLVDHGHAATRSQAQRLIAAGVQWRAETDAPWKKVAKNGDEIPAGAELQLLDTTEAKYISRGGLKLEGALKATGLVAGLRCLDIGQSTGGFHRLPAAARRRAGGGRRRGPRPAASQPARRPARGLHRRRQCACHDGRGPGGRPCGRLGRHGLFDDGEDEDAYEEGPAIEANFDFLTGDLSFISLTLVLPAVVRLLKPGGDLLMLVKPQFELQPGQIGKGGIVRDAAHFEFVEKRLARCLRGAGAGSESLAGIAD